MDKIRFFGYLDFAAIVFSLGSLAFIAEQYDDAGILYAIAIILGFLMWGLHAIKRKPNLPVFFPPRIGNGFLVYGTVSWAILGGLLTFIAIFVDEVSILSMAAVMTAWRTCSVYSLSFLRNRSQVSSSMENA